MGRTAGLLLAAACWALLSGAAGAASCEAITTCHDCVNRTECKWINCSGETFSCGNATDSNCTATSQCSSNSTDSSTAATTTANATIINATTAASATIEGKMTERRYELMVLLHDGNIPFLKDHRCQDQKRALRSTGATSCTAQAIGFPPVIPAHLIPRALYCIFPAHSWSPDQLMCIK
ncbi:uncharacterized protein LOC102458918 isoform X2 [Pelodiscus sinensis]|uniref:uncharacterized protein LOC102458918 isoform X2 n=1 Tax=Pelodiscus sinensis TaxID=13735 RepID=UPI003F6BCCE8